MSRKVLIIAFIAILTLVCVVACKQDASVRTLRGKWTGSITYSVVREDYTLTVDDDTNFTLVESATMFGSKSPDVTVKGTYKFSSDTEGTMTATVPVDVIPTDESTEKTETIPFTLAGNKLTISDPDVGLSVVLTKQD